MRTLRLVDLSCIFWRHWHGAKGKEADAPFGLALAAVRKILDGADLHGVAIDAGHSFRKEILASYKADRPEKAPAARDQLQDVIDRLEADGVHLLRAEGFEADDVIATATLWALGQPEMGVEIYSSDKDLLALVGGERPVCVVRPFEGDVWRAEQVRAKFGVGPELMTQWLTLVGDKSDAVPGVKGIGAVHATKLLTTYGSIANALKAADQTSEMTPAIRKALVEGVAAIELSRKLIELRVDVPIRCEIVLEPVEPKPVERGKRQFTEEPPTPAPEPAATVVQLPTEPRPVPPPATSTALAVVPKEWKLALEPRGPQDAYTLAETLHGSRLFPALGNVDAVFTVILAGRERGLGAFASLSGFHIIKGKIVMSAQLLVGSILKSGKARYFQMVRSDARVAEYVTHRHGNPEPTRMAFTIEDADLAGLLKPSRSGEPTAWDKMPRTMLRWRCAAELGRCEYPDVVGNCYVPGELDEGDIIDAEFEEAS
jgi:hypothetical protein